MRDRRTFGQDFKLFFLRGLVVLLPSILTLWLLVKAFQFVHQAIAEPINGAVQMILVRSSPHIEALREFRPESSEVDAKRRFYEEEVRRGQRRRIPADSQIDLEVRKDLVREWWEEYPPLGLFGFFVAITAIYFAGRLFGGFLGRRIYRRVESAIMALPVFKQVYPYVKQLVDFLFGEDKPMEFKRVVLVEYPRRGIYTVGLLTGSALKTVSQLAEVDSVTVFIPSSPTPFTGYTISVPRSEVMDLPISIEEALRFVVSGGVLMPDREELPPGVDPTKIKAAPSPPRLGGPGDADRPDSGLGGKSGSKRT